MDRARGIPAAEWRAIRADWLLPHRTAITQMLVAVAAAEQLLASELADDPAALAAVRRVWPEAWELTPAEVAAIETLPIEDWRRWPRTPHARSRTGDQP